MQKKYLTLLAVLFIILILLLSPDLCISAAKEGLLLWFNKVLPSLLPFIMLINILSGLSVIQNISSIVSPITKRLWKLPGSSLFALIMGFISGYPMGAKIVKQLIDNHSLSAYDAQKTLCFCNNCGPLFIIGTVGTLMLKNTSIGYFLLLIHIISALLMSILFTFNNQPSADCSRHNRHLSDTKAFNFSELINDSIKNAMDTIVYIGGYIIFFSVIAKIVNTSSLIDYLVHSPLLGQISPQMITSLITGLFEMSNGVNILCQSGSLSVSGLALISFIIGFGGLCVHFQTSYVLGDCDFSLVPYIISKLMQGVLSFILTYLLYPLFLFLAFNKSLMFNFIWFVVLILFIMLFSFMIKVLGHIYNPKHPKSIKKGYIYY